MQQYADQLHWRRTLVRYLPIELSCFIARKNPRQSEQFPVALGSTWMLSIVKKPFFSCLSSLPMTRCPFPHCIKITDLLLII